MNVVIIGQKWQAAELLRQCLEDGHTVAAAVAPDPQDRLPQAFRLPECDVILAAHAHVFIDAATRQRAKLGAVGYHPSLLPRHRGRDAVRWAVHMREPVTGGTLYQMDEGADTGAILLQDWCHIRPDDTAQSLWRRELSPMGLRLFRQYLRCCRAIEPQPQDEALATFEPAFAVRRLSAA